MLRAGPLSDARVIRLINRRFVPFYFDLQPNAAMGDASARKFVTSKLASLGDSTVGTPAVLLMSPQGEVLGKISNYGDAGAFLAELERVLGEHPELAKADAAEAAEKDAVARARILRDLGDVGAALELLDKVDVDEAHLLRGALARESGKRDVATTALRKVQQDGLVDDAAVELAWMAFDADETKEAINLLAAVKSGSDRFVEARYLEGLVRYRDGRTKEAREIWKTLVTSQPEGPWIYRADWAYYDTRPDAKQSASFSTRGSRTASLLGRIGYMGSKHPDLRQPWPH